MTIGEYFSGLFGGIKSLATGMKVTLIELFTPKITQQYPENRGTLVISDRFRGELKMPHDDSNEHACTACGICQMNCPNGTIKVVSDMVVQEDGKKKRVLNTYNYDLGMCTFCNLCVITCPTGAIEFSNNFENALYTRGRLVQKLNAENSKLREKKAAPKPTAPTPKEEVPTEVKMAEKLIVAQTEAQPVEPVIDIMTEETKPAEAINKKEPVAETPQVATEKTEEPEALEVKKEDKKDNE